MLGRNRIYLIAAVLILIAGGIFVLAQRNGMSPVGQEPVPPSPITPSSTDAQTATSTAATTTPPVSKIQDPLPAFPGAEGYGADTVGGRGGHVIAVTNLNDEGPGSLRAALMETGPRIVVFAVGGTIELESKIALGEAQSYLTLAGQTAPGDGVQVKGWDIALTEGIHDVVVRYMRLRPGETGAEDWSKDSLSMYGDSEANKVHHIVIDHCSLYWGPDEAADTWNWAENITWQWNLIEDIAHDTGDRFEESKAMLIGFEDDRAERIRNISIHHNFMANNAQRSPAASGDGPHQIINNLVYNWRDFGTELNYDGGPGTRVNLIGNYYRRGPESNTARYAVGTGIRMKNPDGLIYVKDNLGPFREGESMPEWAIVGKGYLLSDSDGNDYWEVPADPAMQKHTPWPQPPIPITVSPARNVPQLVLAGAGATKPVRDALDARVVNDFKNGTGSIKLASEQQDSWWPQLRSGTAPLDTDEDGMPDVWERARQLNPSNSADGNTDKDGDGYTNVEEYLNAL